MPQLPLTPTVMLTTGRMIGSRYMDNGAQEAFDLANPESTANLSDEERKEFMELVSMFRQNPAKSLYCSCCGARTVGHRQHWNRDTGYGICPDCCAWIMTRNRKEEFPSIMAFMTNLYGHFGIHWSLPKFEDSKIKLFLIDDRCEPLTQLLLDNKDDDEGCAWLNGCTIGQHFAGPVTVTRIA